MLRRTLRARLGAGAVGVGMLLALFALSCGGDGDGGGAGAPAEASQLGERCGVGCAQGTICERSGAFAGVCSTSCTGDAGCQLISPAARCFEGRCALRCEIPSQCPSRTVCSPFGSTMACVSDGL